MKKSNMRMLALLLALVMVMGLVGCSKKGEDTKKDETPTTTQAPATTDAPATTAPEATAEPTAEPEPEEETYDFGGVTVKCFGAVWNDLDNTERSNIVEAKNYVEQKYNIKLEKATMEGYDGYNDDDLLIASIAAGDPAAHIINLNPESMVTCFTNDILFDLTDSLDKLQVGHAYTDVATWKGRVYGVAYENIGDTWVLVYDRDYLKEIGMEKTPTDMFMEGKWDYESFRAYCAEMKSKLPEDVYPIGNYWTHWGMMAPSANGVQVVDANGNLNLTNEGVIEAIEFYQKLENDKLAFPMWLTRDDEGKVTDADYAYALDDERIVMKRAEVWQLGGIQGNWGIAYWPWGSNVTCTGDYTTLSDNYHTAGVYWGFDAIVKAAVDATGIPGEVLALIDQDFRNAANDEGDNFSWMHEAYLQEQLGNYANEGPEAGEPRSFCTEQDIELFDWGHTRYQAEYTWAFNSAFAVSGSEANINRAFQMALIEYKDVRSELEAAQNAFEAVLKDAGVK